ncbi:unnamed protein product [Lupinus luteus]|uniref:beta-ketoacyl-[acyl-carrier-protein] synthase I n=1 Tax=Lupinus luteus TaxID=3873 RepID=A0AAV1VY11_LUPLU
MVLMLLGRSEEKVTGVDLALAPKLYHLVIALGHFKNWAIPESLAHVRNYIKVKHRLCNFTKKSRQQKNLLQNKGSSCDRLSEIESFDCADFPTRIVGEIKSFSTEGWVAPKLSKRMDKFMLYMLIAGKKALIDGGITKDVMDELNKEKCGVLIGSGMGGMKVTSDSIEALRVSYRKLTPFSVLLQHQI